MKRSAWLLFVPLVLAGCQSSTRTIDLQSGLFSVEQPVPVSGFIPTLFSSDGARMGGFVTEGDAFYFEVRDRDSEEPLTRFSVDENTYLPVLFTPSGDSLVMATFSDGAVDTKVVPITHDMTTFASAEPTSLFGWPNGMNHDFSLVAGQGLAVTNRGKVVRVEGGEDETYFDMYGSAWFKMKAGGWTSVCRDGTVTKSKDRPAYLVTDPRNHRGSMHLARTETKMEYSNGSAFVTAIWLKHDRALKGWIPNQRRERNSAALVKVATDLIDFGFVPGRNEVLVIDGEGATFVPYLEEPR